MYSRIVHCSAVSLSVSTVLDQHPSDSQRLHIQRNGDGIISAQRVCDGKGAFLNVDIRLTDNSSIVQGKGEVSLDREQGRIEDHGQASVLYEGVDM